MLPQKPDLLCPHIRQVRKQDVTKHIAEAALDYCLYKHTPARARLCLECGKVCCEQSVSPQSPPSCLESHAKEQGHSISLSLFSGQIGCSACNIDSFRSLVIGYTGTDEGGLSKLRLFTDYISKCWSERQSSKQLSKEQQDRLCGLVNLANTCYLNSVLQCLLSTALAETYSRLDLEGAAKVRCRIDSEVEYFYDEMLEKKSEEEWHVVTAARRTKQTLRPLRATAVRDFELNLQFQRFVREVEKSSGRSCSPLKLFQCLGYLDQTFKDPKRQNDAQQCMRVLLDALSEGELLFLDINLERYRRVEKCLGPQKLSLVDRMFGTYLASRVLCLRCERVTWTVDLALDIEVELSSTKERPALGRGSRTEAGVIDPAALRYPYAVRFPQQQPAPPRLIEHFFGQEALSKSNFYSCEGCKCSNALKRFYLLQPGEVLTIVIKRFKGLTKDCTHLPFDEELNVQAVTLVRENARASRYLLESVVVHEGGSASQGHYICCRRIDGCWVIFNDEKVMATTWDRVRSMQAYILVYKRL